MLALKSLAAVWQLATTPEFAISVAASIVAAFLIALWQGWVRRILVAICSWVLSIKAEAKAQPKPLHLKRALLIQSGDRRGIHWFRNVPRVGSHFYDVTAQVLITSLEDGIQITKVILRYRRGWLPLIPAKCEGDIALTNPLEPSTMPWDVLPSNKMIYGQCKWRFPAAFRLSEPETLKARVSLIDQLHRESLSGWFSIYWMNDPDRPS